MTTFEDLDDLYAWQHRDRAPLATCPVCAALVANEPLQIQKHIEWHKRTLRPEEEPEYVLEKL